jgi:hypothetical protein
MIEVFLIVLIVSIFLLVFFVYTSSIPKLLLVEKEQELLLKIDKLKVAKKKFFQGKIKQVIFDEIKTNLEIEIILKELEILRLKKTRLLRVEEKLDQIISRIKKPTHYKKIKLKELLFESEFIVKELDLIEKRFLKNEISNKAFEQLIRLKEHEMIEKEAQIIQFVQKHNQ